MKIIAFYYSTTYQKTILILEDGTIQTNTTKPKNLLKQWCYEAGSSLEGRITCFKQKMHSVQKPIILIRLNSPLVYMPTVSMTRSDCLYLRYDSIIKVSKVNEDYSEILFEKGIRYRVQLDIRILRFQLKRCQHYLQYLKQF